jgi:hypothetical protein
MYNKIYAPVTEDYWIRRNQIRPLAKQKNLLGWHQQRLNQTSPLKMMMNGERRHQNFSSWKIHETLERMVP